jgi:hypothetical protein
MTFDEHQSLDETNDIRTLNQELLAQSKTNLEWMREFQASFQAGHLAAVTRAVLQKRIEATEKAIAKAEGRE